MDFLKILPFKFKSIFLKKKKIKKILRNGIYDLKNSKTSDFELIKSVYKKQKKLKKKIFVAFFMFKKKTVNKPKGKISVCAGK